jgi:hypothetical protein
MDGTRVISVSSPGQLLTVGTHFVGIGDLDADGKADILVRERTGAVTVWFMNGQTVVDRRPIGIVPLEWTVARMGDFNGDGTSDILWRHASGALYQWIMSGTSVISHGPLIAPDSQWQLY